MLKLSMSLFATTVWKKCLRTDLKIFTVTRRIDMKLQNVIMELEAIESVRNELKKAVDKRQAWEILGRLLNLYSALNVTDIKENLEAQVYSDERKAA
jgi:hypothetical protein